MSEQELGKKAFELHSQIIANEQLRRKLLADNMLMLSNMHSQELYKCILGDEEAPWSGYLAEVEVYYTRGKVARWIYIINHLIDEYNLDIKNLISIPESRLEEIARYATPENYEDLLDNAKVQTPQDWRNTLLELKGKPTSETCEHIKVKKLSVCEDCGYKHQIE